MKDPRNEDPRFDKKETVEGLEAFEATGAKLLASVWKYSPDSIREGLEEFEGREIHYGSWVLEEIENPDKEAGGRCIAASSGGVLQMVFPSPEWAEALLKGVYLALHGVSYFE